MGEERGHTLVFCRFFCDILVRSQRCLVLTAEETLQTAGLLLLRRQLPSMGQSSNKQPW